MAFQAKSLTEAPFPVATGVLMAKGSMTARRVRCQADLIFQILRKKCLDLTAKAIVQGLAIALYSIPMAPPNNPSQPDRDDVVSRRGFGGKLLYVPPTVLAVIKASERPALAQSLPQ